MFLSEWREFPSTPCLAWKKNSMTARVSTLLKSHASLTCFQACFFPCRAKDLPAPQYITYSTRGDGEDYTTPTKNLLLFISLPITLTAHSKSHIFQMKSPHTYRVIQEESAIVWEMIVCVILSKKVHMNKGPILNGYQDMVKRRYGPSCEHEQQLRNK